MLRKPKAWFAQFGIESNDLSIDEREIEMFLWEYQHRITGPARILPEELEFVAFHNREAERYFDGSELSLTGGCLSPKRWFASP